MSVTGARRSRVAGCVLFACTLLSMASDAIPVAAQRRIDSPVFRTYRPPRQQAPPQNPDPEQQWRDLTLIREANAGDKFAQHELGLRYLFGDGFASDTIRAAMWIGRAAKQGLVQASYNYALLVGNGLGTDWNPFESAQLLKFAAERGMAEAQLNLGLLYTDDLVFARDWKEAYRWIRLAADSGYAPAKEAAAELLRRGFLKDENGGTPASLKHGAGDHRGAPAGGTANGASVGSGGAPSWSPIFLDFQRGNDSMGIDVPDVATLAKEADATVGVELLDSSALHGESPADEVAALKRMLHTDPLLDAAALANPEAVILYGRCLEIGVIGTGDQVVAMEQYIRGMYIDAVRAYPLLMALFRQKGFVAGVRKRAMDTDASAKLVLAELTLLGLDREITDEQSIALLRASAESGHSQSAVQLGLLFQSGRLVKRDTRAAEELWRRAASAGNKEGAVRLAAVIAFSEEDDAQLSSAIDTLRGAQRRGSIIAQVALASCSERGHGLSKDEGAAARGYRQAAARGSRLAYAALKRMVERKR